MAWILIYIAYSETPQIRPIYTRQKDMELNGRLNKKGEPYGSNEFKNEYNYINIKSPLKFNAMKKLIALFKVSKEQPRCLSSFLKIEFKEELVNIDMPHVGGYKPGSRTKIAR